MRSLREFAFGALVFALGITLAHLARFLDPSNRGDDLSRAGELILVVMLVAAGVSLVAMLNRRGAASSDAAGADSAGVRPTRAKQAVSQLGVGVFLLAFFYGLIELASILLPGNATDDLTAPAVIGLAFVVFAAGDLYTKISRGSWRCR